MGPEYLAVSNDVRSLIRAARLLSSTVNDLRFGEPVAYVYNPLAYAWPAYREYLRRYGEPPKRVVFVGMNPGPWGMAQTGVPFGEVVAVRDWMGISAEIGRPQRMHPRKPVLGFAVHRSEASGKRLWGLMRERFGTAEHFFREHFVANYCPLLFLDGEGRNITPDKLRSADRKTLFALCDAHLRAVLQYSRPEWAIGIGRFTERRIRLVSENEGWRHLKIGGVLHPSPANPQANRGWAARITAELAAVGVW